MERKLLRIFIVDGSSFDIELPFINPGLFRETIFKIMQEGFSYGVSFYPAHSIRMVQEVEPVKEKPKAVIDPPNCKGKSKNKNPDDMCKNCNCWKKTREMCS